MKKFFILLFFSCLVCMNSFGDEIILQTSAGNTPPVGQGGKSPSAMVTASLENQALTLSFTPSTSSQVVITDSQTNTVVYSGAFGVASSQVIPLSSLSAGVYVLSIYAFGVWWEGEFEIE